MAKDGKKYHNIDLEKTGRKLRNMLISSGLTVQEIQEYLYLSCPQPIYRWFRGQILPSVDHLYMLSRLLGVHMEDLIVPVQPQPFALVDIEGTTYFRRKMGRMYKYFCGSYGAA